MAEPTIVVPCWITRAQADFLAAHGCDELQGYLFSAPLPADKFAQWLGTYQG